MTQYAALLRAINVGKRRVKMEKLKSIFADAGFSRVSTLIASGNVWFESPLKSAIKLRTQIEQSLFNELGFEVDTFLRTASQLKSVIENNPFSSDQLNNDSIQVHVLFFHEPIAQESAEVLRRNATSTDQVTTIGTEVYWRCRGRMTDSIYWNQPEIKKLKLPNNTARNIETIKRMSAAVLDA